MRSEVLDEATALVFWSFVLAISWEKRLVEFEMLLCGGDILDSSSRNGKLAAEEAGVAICRWSRSSDWMFAV
jgi:hypothetical protein